MLGQGTTGQTHAGAGKHESLYQDLALTPALKEEKEQPQELDGGEEHSRQRE